MNLITVQKPLDKTKKLLGNKIIDVIDTLKKPFIVYKFKKGECYIFSNAPFRSLYVENSIVQTIDEFKETRKEPRYEIAGLVFAAPNGNTEYTIVGDIVNISMSAVCIKPYKKQELSDCTWKMHIDLGNRCFDAFGNIIRNTNDTIVFKFIEKLKFDIEVFE